MSSLAFSQGLDYIIQQLVQFANSLRWLGYVCMPVKGGLAASSHSASGMPAPGAQTLWHVEALSDVAVSFEMLHHHVNVLPDALVLSHYYYNPNPNSVVSIARRHSTLVDPKVIMAPNANKKKAGTKAKVSTSKVQASPMSMGKTFFILDIIPTVHMAFSPLPLTAIWWHDKHSGYVLETKCNDVMSKIGFYSVKDMTRDGLDVSTSFASVHVLLSMFTSEANTISAGFDKAPAMFCNGSSPTKDVMSSQTVSYADALHNFPEGVYVPSPLPPYFDHPFLLHKCSSAAGSSAAGSSATSSSAIGVKRTLPPLLQFTKRQRTEGIVAEGGDIMMEDGGNVSIPTIDGDRDVVMQDGASVAATTPSSGAAMHSSHVRFLLGHPILSTCQMWIGSSKKHLP
ncbi:hypothetical protein BS47DRAFT_1365340 [Hydnum rufescens UP504]|uniref:Uncharacterized protein n=1 Tax=Hydnum rufescens UP504 TaxID=1448309 RepID=A0A9P6AP37_9AGAM|nr:hypothetical protein BS47DRAFT_1365340 [Hydnum rufescens UP504]